MKRIVMGVAACAVVLSGMGCRKQPSNASVIRVDGSSTVFPITEAVAEEFQKGHPGVRVTVGISGTGGGFKKFGMGETDLSDSGMAEFKTLAELQKLYPQFEAHSKAVTSPSASLFQSPDLRRYGLIQDLSLPEVAAPHARRGPATTRLAKAGHDSARRLSRPSLTTD